MVMMMVPLSLYSECLIKIFTPTVKFYFRMYSRALQSGTGPWHRDKTVSAFIRRDQPMPPLQNRPAAEHQSKHPPPTYQQVAHQLPLYS
jgi:hypothetical protein